jgi:hypothetical protein
MNVPRARTTAAQVLGNRGAPLRLQRLGRPRRIGCTDRRLGTAGALLHRRAAVCSFHPGEESEQLVKLMLKYAGVPMSFADACLVRMSETMSDPLVLTTSAAFRVYRRHGRWAVPCVWPGQLVPQQGADMEPEGRPELDEVLKDVRRIFRDND